MAILGIDPGVSGGAALLNSRTYVEVRSFKAGTEADMAEWIMGRQYLIEKAYIEEVHSMPKQGVVSVFTFGQNYGWWRGLLMARGICFERVRPLKWQTVMQCKTKGDKNVTKQLAQELFPGVKVTHAIADALLIAEYGLRQGD